MRILAALMLALSLTACISAPPSSHSAVPQPWPEEICVIESPAIREGFLITLTDALESKGFQVTVIDTKSSLDACPWTLTYGANWRWDLALYMETAQLAVYKDNWPIGETYYHGGYGLDKFIDAEPKIVELVDQLFPESTDVENE